MALPSQSTQVSAAPGFTLHRVATLSIGLLTLILLYMMFFVYSPIPPVIVATALGALATLLGFRGVRWAPLLTAILGLLIFASLGMGGLINSGRAPTEYLPFALAIPLISGVTVGTGVGAFIQQRRGDAPSAPRWLATLLVALVALWVGAVGLAGIRTPAAASAINGVSPNSLASIPLVSMTDSHFGHTDFQAKVGELVVLRLVNEGQQVHLFEIAEFNLHVEVAPGQSGLAVFRPTEAGSYLIYCGPHYDKAKGTGMKATLNVSA